MYTYAENDSTTRTKPRRHDDAVEQPDVAQSRWTDQVERIGCDGEWNFELADSMPFLVSELPCWREGGLALHVWNGPTHASFGASAHSVGDVYIEVAGEHYWALIDGERVWIRPDGNCFFNAIWKALQASGNADAIKRIFRGNVPANEREASNYFRREIRDYALRHPELEAILLGDDGSPVARRESLSTRDAAIGNDMGATPESFRALQGLRGEVDETDADEFLDALATADWLAQPERREKPAFEPQQAGSNEASRPQKRVRRLTPFANQYRSASGIDQETPENGFFRTAADIAKRMGEQMGRPAAVASRVYRERQEIFRALGADDVLKALSPVLIPDGFEDAACDADWLPQTAQDAGLAESDRDEMAALLRTPTRVKWSTPLVEYRPIPHACHTEFQRVLFSAGSQLSGWLAYSGLLSFGYWILGIGEGLAHGERRRRCGHNGVQPGDRVEAARCAGWTRPGATGASLSAAFPAIASICHRRGDETVYRRGDGRGGSRMPDEPAGKYLHGCRARRTPFVLRIFCQAAGSQPTCVQRSRAKSLPTKRIPPWKRYAASRNPAWPDHGGNDRQTATGGTGICGFANDRECGVRHPGA